MTRSGGLLLCFVSSAVGVGAAAPDLSARWPQRVAATLFFREICRNAFPCVLLRGQCAGGCAIAEWKERTGMEVRERGGQGSRWVSRRGGPCPPNPALLLSGTLSLTSQHLSRRHQHAERQRMPPQPRVRPEGTCLLLRSEGVTPCGTATCPKTSSRSPYTTPGSGRGVFASWRTPRWNPSFPPGGRSAYFPLVLTHEVFFLF
ncbi:hypothetical protein TcCL_Unassigned00364 [Trypanosoma cruzi]|nr:hypothetical protein TcCL_Unassigned00364 [Trypanosoma cruzi]